LETKDKLTDGIHLSCCSVPVFPFYDVESRKNKMWAIYLKNGKNVLLQHADAIRSVLDSISSSYNVWLKFVNHTGEYIYTPRCRDQSNFCRLIRSHPEGYRRCRDTAVKCACFTPGKPSIFICHAGLLVLTVPLVCGQERIGALATGEMRVPEEDETDARRALLCDLNLDRDLLQKHYAGISVWKREDVLQLGRLISVISNCFLNLGMMVGEKNRAEMERVLGESELKALSAQISPHFLFNSLNAIQMVSYLEDASQTSNLINALANILRARMDISPYFTTLGEEVQVLKNLFFIQKTRFEDRLQVTISIPDNLLGIQIPSLSLQPLVENALIHGLEPKEGNGKLELKALAEGEDVVFLVQDDGVGIDPGELSRIRGRLNSETDGAGKGIGLVNINRRCRNLFGVTYGIEINSVRNRGTEVRLRLPIFIRSDKGCDRDETIARR
jgi:two-component system LytT family sensor kinase